MLCQAGWHERDAEIMKPVNSAICPQRGHATPDLPCLRVNRMGAFSFGTVDWEESRIAVLYACRCLAHRLS